MYIKHILFFSFIFLNLIGLVAQDKVNPKHTPEHIVLRKFEGDWKEVYVYFPIAGSSNVSNQHEGRTETKNQMIFGKLIMQMETNFKLAGVDYGMKRFMGWDSEKGKYYINIIDAFGSVPILLHGDYNEKNNQFVFLRKANTNEGEEFDIRLLMKFERDDKYISTIYYIQNKKEYKVFESACIKK